MFQKKKIVASLFGLVLANDLSNLSIDIFIKFSFLY